MQISSSFYVVLTWNSLRPIQGRLWVASSHRITPKLYTSHFVDTPPSLSLKHSGALKEHRKSGGQRVMAQRVGAKECGREVCGAAVKRENASKGVHGLVAPCQTIVGGTAFDAGLQALQVSDT